MKGGSWRPRRFYGEERRKCIDMCDTYVLSELFGNCPQVKIVETFAEYYDDTLSGSDIVQMTGVSKATVYSHIDKLLKEDIIEKAEKVGKTQLYQLNSKNPKAKIVLILERFIVAERLSMDLHRTMSN